MAQKYIKISNHVTGLQVIGDSRHPNSLQSTLREAIIGTNCTSIAPSCFIGCENLEKVHIPSTCKEIGDYAFCGCKKLKTINILDPEEQSIVYLGNHCFDGCTSLGPDIWLTLSSAVSRDSGLGEYVFANCSSLTSFSHTANGWAAYGSYMLSGCTNLKTLNLRHQTNTIVPHALAGIPNIEEITLPNNVWILSEGMFQNDTKLKSLTIEDTVSASVMDRVYSDVFEGCSCLTSVVLPKSISRIDQVDDFFLRGSNVSSVTFTGIPDDAFAVVPQQSQDSAAFTYTGEITTLEEFKCFAKIAYENNYPILIHGTKGDLKSDGTDTCGECNSQNKIYNKAPLKDAMEANKSKFYYVHASVYQNNRKLPADQSLWKYIFNTSNPIPELHIKNAANFGGKYSEYAQTKFYWHKKDGTTIAKRVYLGVKGTTSAQRDDYNLEQLVAELNSTTDEVQTTGSGSSGSETSIAAVNSKITKLGSSFPSVIFISSSGRSYTITNEAITFHMNWPVDMDTVKDFKYGIWYYNAKELRKFADDNGIPCFVEYSSAGCPPCEYFRTQIFNTREFQNWSAKSPYLFCRIETPEDAKNAFVDNVNYPESYYVDKVWGKEIYKDNSIYLPVLLWYWKDKSGNLQVSEYSTYHYNPGKKNLTAQELMDKIDNMFKNYKAEDKFKAPPRTELSTNSDQFVGYVYSNIPDDKTGIYFPADKKTEVDSVSKIIDIKGHNVLRSLSKGDELAQFGLSTYYVFTASGYSPYPDSAGIIFKVEEDETDHKHKVSWIIETERFYDHAEDYSEPAVPQSKYELGKWLDLPDNDTGISALSAIVEDAETLTVPMIIIKATAKESSEVGSIKAGTESFAAKTAAYFINLEIKNKTSGLGKEYYEKFWNGDTRKSKMPGWKDKPLPQILVYEACNHCSMDGSAAVYAVGTFETSGLDGRQIEDKITEILEDVS